MSAPVTQIVRGELAFVGAPVDLTGASVRIRLDDISRADAPALTAAQHAIEKLPAGSTTAVPIPFELPVGRLSDRAQYSFWAHVDVDLDGIVSPGDFITMESSPFEPARTSVHRVTLRRVG